MTERLSYDIDEARQLSLYVPHNILNQTIKETRLKEILDSPLGIVEDQANAQGHTLTFSWEPFLAVNERRIEESRTNNVKSYASMQFYALQKIADLTPEDQLDPTVQVRMQMTSQDASGQNRRGMQADLHWSPERSNEDLDMAARHATLQLRHSAIALGVLKKSIQDSAYAQAGFETGIEFQALDIGCCCLATDGMDGYESLRLGEAQVHGHNLYNHQVMLTCLNGLVAFTKHLKSL